MDEVLLALTLIFVAAAVLLLVATRYDLPVVPFYLLAGILVGAFIEEAHVIDLAQWGIAFLVFLFGVHVDVEAVRSRGGAVAAVAVGQATAVGGLAAGVGLLAGLSSLNAVYLGLAAALSSSLVSVSYLDVQSGELAGFERIAETIHFTEDILGVLAVLALSAFVYVEVATPEQLVVAGGMLAAALAIRYLAFDWLTRYAGGDEEVLMLLGITAILGFIAVSEAVGLSIVVGAFAAGIAVADDYPHSLELVDTIDDLEDFFTPIFFVTIGALLAVPSLATLGFATLLIVVILVVNPIVTAVGLAAAGHEPRTAIFAGLTLDQVSALSLFVALEAVGEGTIDRPVFDAIVIAAVVTMLASSVTDQYRAAIHRRVHDLGLSRLLVHARSTYVDVPERTTDHVVLVGLEHADPSLLEAIADRRDVVVIADDRDALAAAAERDVGVVFGDLLADRTWERAGHEDAAMVVSLTPEPDRRRAVLERTGPAHRVVRVENEREARACLEAGADGVLSPDAISGVALREDLAALVAGEISPAAFSERGRPP